MKSQLLLIDGSSYIFRAFYGVRASLKNKEGLPTNAVFGFKNMLLQLLKSEDPSHCVMVFDKSGPVKFSYRRRLGNRPSHHGLPGSDEGVEGE